MEKKRRKEGENRKEEREDEGKPGRDGEGKG